jgi:formylglycine-generating enzyme required for sulfatase activity
MNWVYLLVLAVGLAFTTAPAQADPERRVALIIGNDAYRNLPKLSNAANDARAMERELKAAGFETTVKLDAGRREMNNAINDFAGKLSTGAVGLFYYAGHGIQAKDRNYLVPVDAQVETEADLEVEAIEGGKVMRSMEEARNRLNIVILDACRDNPLPKGRSASRGLAVMPAPTGTFVAYATGPGQIAQDGDKGANGVFTGELVKALRQPGLSIEQVFKTAAGGVRERTGGKQVPWIQASIQGDFFFRPPNAGQPVVRSDGGGGNQAELLFWSSIQSSSRASDFQAYLDKYPSGDFVALARSRLDELKGAKVAALAPPRHEVALDGMDREMVAARKAGVREAPDGKAKQVLALAEGDSVQVTGKVKGENWYAISRKGQSGYVVTDTLEEAGAYKERKAKEAREAQEAADAERQLQQVAALAAAERERQRQQFAAIAPGQSFRECPDCPEMVMIPAGSFMMGSPASEPGRESKEGPQHPVSIRGFALGKYPVTYTEWDACVADGGCGGYRARDRGWGRGNRPVTDASWKDAQAYIGWLNGKLGGAVQASVGAAGPYRLPSEAEWEYAARAGTTTAYYWGAEFSPGHAACKTCGSQWDNKQTAPVGSFAPNGFGLYDIMGVNQWVQDVSPGSSGSYAGAPSDGSAVQGDDYSWRGMRGSHHSSDPKYLRSAFRSSWHPSDHDTYLGFRIARTLP